MLNLTAALHSSPSLSRPIIQPRCWRKGWLKYSPGSDVTVDRGWAGGVGVGGGGSLLEWTVTVVSVDTGLGQAKMSGEVGWFMKGGEAIWKQDNY